MTYLTAKQKKTSECLENTNNSFIKYFFMSVFVVEIVFIVWRFIYSPTKNSGTFLVTFIIVSVFSLPFGLGLTLNLFNKKDISFYFTFGLCIGYGFMASVWALMIRVGCPLNPFIYIGVVFSIAGYLYYRKIHELKLFFTQFTQPDCLVKLLPPITVLLCAFIVLSNTWLNSYVPTDVDCQSDGYNTLMILKEGSYPIVSPYLDKTQLQLNSGQLFHTLTAVITKLKNSVLISEIMAITVISGAFFCMAIYFLASFIFKNEIILFIAGILTLTRAYLSFINDGNLPENIAYYYAALFIVFLMYTLHKKRIIFAIITGLCLSFCMWSHPNVFIYNFPPFCLFFITFLISTGKNIKKDYINLFTVIGVVLILILPQVFKLNEGQSKQLYENHATTFLDSLPYWNGYLVPILALVGVILIAAKRKTINIYIWTYFLMVLVFVENWRFYQLFSPSWFELRPLEVQTFGAKYLYTTYLQNPNNFISAWQGGVIIWPVSITMVFNIFYRLCQRYIKMNVLNNCFLVFLAILAFCFIGYEFKKAKRYPEWILKSDYAAMKWLRENTNYESTLIYAPYDNAQNNPIPEYIISYWIPVVSERKAIIFRNYYHSVQFKFLNLDKTIDKKIKQIQDAAYTIMDEKSYKIFKDMKISHIFISGFLSGKLLSAYQNSPFVELVFYNTLPDHGTALVYRVK